MIAYSHTYLFFCSRVWTNLHFLQHLLRVVLSEYDVIHKLHWFWKILIVRTSQTLWLKSQGRGAKPTTKHIFVAPLISFYGCVPDCQRSAEPSRNIWSGSARLCAPIEGKSERHVKTTIKDDHNQRWPQSNMTTIKDDHKKSQIFGQVEIGGNLTSAVNCEAGDSSFEAAPPPKLASQALSH